MRGVPSYWMGTRKADGTLPAGMPDIPPMPQLPYWYGLGQLMREGLVRPWRVEELSLEMYVFYLAVLEHEAKIQQEKIDETRKKAKRPRLHK